MDLVISSLIGAIAAVLAAYITSKVNDRKKDKLVKELQERFQIDNRNVYIINTKENAIHNFRHESKGSTGDKSIILIK